jgi:hypothetical protein
MKNKVIFMLAVAIVLWSVCSMLGISQFGSWAMPALIAMALVAIITPDLFPEKWKSFGPYPIGRKGKEKLLGQIVDQERKILGKIDLLGTLFFPLSAVVAGFYIKQLTTPLTDPRLVMEHDANIVANILFILMAYTVILLTGYLMRQNFLKKLDASWENRQHLIFAISVSSQGS